MNVIAIDTGGTKIMGAVVDDGGSILEKVKYENTGRTGPFILNTYCKIIDGFLRKHRISAIGIGAGGRIDTETGRVVFAAGIYQDYIGCEIKKTIEERFRIPTTVDNDCKVAVLGESWASPVKKFGNVFGLILGTGVGGGILYNGRMIGGTHGGAGEIGHWILHPDGRPCTCGQNGCVEQYLSGTALWSLYNEKCGADTIQSGYAFFSRVSRKDAAALQVLDGFVRDLAVLSVSCANLFDPQAILFGGGLLDTYPYWWDAFTEQYAALGNVHTKHVELIRAANGNSAAILGAAYLALQISSQSADQRR
ncbi:ROK family protein [Caproiciproducens sp.]|uniref:ROK family protein n=1 Tax=Caproiciproducens sp. TaxID=1954376 RepID=UPI00289AFFB0|nr:ROK family protein [Caproiciproducens sp.]